MIGKKKFYELLRMGPKRGYHVKHPILRKRAQVKGGVQRAKNIAVMKAIGALGGKNGGGPHRKPGSHYAHPEIAALIRAQRRAGVAY